MIGLYILGLILTPLFILLAATVLDRGIVPRVPFMFTAMFLLQLIAILGGFAVFASLLSLVIR